MHGTMKVKVTLDQYCTNSLDNCHLTTGNCYPMAQHLKTQNVFSVLHHYFPDFNSVWNSDSDCKHKSTMKHSLQYKKS